MTPGILQSRGHRVLIGTLIVLSLIPIWAVEYFPSQNGPWSLLMAKMLVDYNNPAFNYAAYYEPSWHAIPHMLHTLIVYALGLVMPVLTAHKVAISAFVVLFPISVFVFLESIDPRRTVLGYASFLFVYNVPLLRGYHDYSIGLPLVVRERALTTLPERVQTMRAVLDEVIARMRVSKKAANYFGFTAIRYNRFIDTIPPLTEWAANMTKGGEASGHREDAEVARPA